MDSEYTNSIYHDILILIFQEPRTETFKRSLN